MRVILLWQTGRTTQTYVPQNLPRLGEAHLPKRPFRRFPKSQMGHILKKVTNCSIFVSSYWKKKTVIAW
jgi:hypothetical protein